jgi:hypothetical protein
MAITKQAVVILASTSVPAGTTLASPVAGSAVDVRTYAGGEWGYKITNGSGAPSIAVSLQLQTSRTGTGTDWRDYGPPFSGSTAANGVVSGSVTMSRGVMYARAIAYGNTTSAVTVESDLQATVG